LHYSNDVEHWEVTIWT